jgi:hypothetical protein
MWARDAKFGDDLVQAYGIVWMEDLFEQGDEDSRYTTQVDAFLGAQHEWMSHHLPTKAIILQTDESGTPKLPPKAIPVLGKPGRGVTVGHYRRNVKMSPLSNLEMSASFPGELEAGGGLGGDERARCAALAAKLLQNARIGSYAASRRADGPLIWEMSVELFAVPRCRRVVGRVVFGRRPPRRVDGPAIPASENLRRSGHSGEPPNTGRLVTRTDCKGDTIQWPSKSRF